VSDDLISVEEFAAAARAWIAANMPPADPGAGHFFFTDQSSRTDADDLARIDRCRELQRILFDGGYAGIVVPKEYGGQGLTPEHQYAFNRELRGHDFPLEIQASTFIPCMALLLEFGTEDQKQRHIPKMLRGEEVWAQFLSEPGGGSDAAGAVTTAVRDGDQWVLNGSKIWTTGAWYSDWAMCLARTNWDVEKHRGLTIFSLPVHSPGVEVHRVELVNGSKEFCQEFLSDVRVPDADRIGAVDDGWTVGTRWMFHERMMHNSPLVTMPTGVVHGRAGFKGVLDVARASGRLHDPVARDLLGEARMLEVVREHLQQRVSRGIATGTMSDQSAGIARLFHGVTGSRMNTIAFEIADELGAAWTDDDGAAGHAGVDFLMRQTAQIGGGTTEMARNVISERLLGMPRERTYDRDVPFRDVPRGPSH